MIVVTGGDRDSSYGGLFTGHVELEMLHAASNEQEPDTALVHFQSGAVTNWHHHPGGQLLFVVSGEARVGTSSLRHQTRPTGMGRWTGLIAPCLLLPGGPPVGTTQYRT